jgi:carbonyl reductase 1
MVVLPPSPAEIRALALPLVRVVLYSALNISLIAAAVRQIALQYPTSSFNNGPLLIYLTARDNDRGQAAVQHLLSDSQLARAKALSKDGGLADIKYAKLDISSSNSIRSFANFLQKEHPEGVDFVINNAAIGMDGFGVQ